MDKEWVLWGQECTVDRGGQISGNKEANTVDNRGYCKPKEGVLWIKRG